LPKEKPIRHCMRYGWKHLPAGTAPPVHPADPEAIARSFDFSTIKQPPVLRNEEALDLLYEVDYQGDLKLRHDHLYDFNKVKRKENFEKKKKESELKTE